MEFSKYYSIEFLRGILALIVATCHFLLINSENINFEVISSLSVEIFFVISGFVLAPQILRIFNTSKFINFRIFLTRRFLRTVPIYLFYLILISIFLGEIFTKNFFKHFFFIQNFLEISQENDYYPIAWSLSVEEWFYLLFIPFLFLTNKFLQKEVAYYLIFWIFIFFFIRLIYFLNNDFSFGQDIRRITLFRLDAISFGIIFYIYKQYIIELLNKFKKFAFFFLFILYLIFVNNIGTNSVFISQILLLICNLFSIICFYFFITEENFFKKKLKKISIFLGRVSYSIYLSHLLIILVLKKFNLLEFSFLSFLLFLTSTIFISFLSRSLIEEPLLTLRPKFKF